jgi:HAD superfamily hydrolase (TIGR01509 family)
MRRFDAVIFDMDGVLIDSEPLHFEVLNAVLGLDGQSLTREENEAFIGTTSEFMFSTLIARHRLPRSVADYLTLYDAMLLRALEQPRAPQPGVERLIACAREREMRLAVASSSRRLWIDATLHSLSLGSTFEVIVSGDDVLRSKPDPAIYTLAAERLGVPPSRCLAIEDAPNGVTSARRAGMPVLGVRTPYTAHLQLEGALQVVNSLTEIDLCQYAGEITPA